MTLTRLARYMIQQLKAESALLRASGKLELEHRFAEQHQGRPGEPTMAEPGLTIGARRQLP